MISAFAIAPVKLKSNLNLLFATEFSGITLAAPSGFGGGGSPGTGIHVAGGGTVPNYYNYYCDNSLLGTDTETGFAVPAAAPLYSSVKYGVYVIDWYDGFPSNDRAGVNVGHPIAVEDCVIDGIATKCLSITQKASAAPLHVDGYRKQAWYTLHRDVAVAADLPKLFIQYDLWLPDFIAAGVFTVTNRRITIFDVKTSGDFRYTVNIIYANSSDAAQFGTTVGTLGFEIIGDNNANGGLPFDEFFRVKIFDVPVPQGEFFKIDYCWKRAASSADLLSGRFRLRYKKYGDSEYTTVWDQYPETNAAYAAEFGITSLSGVLNRNIQMGVNLNKIQRMFIAGIYGKYEKVDVTIKVANVEIWDGLIN